MERKEFFTQIYILAIAAVAMWLGTLSALLWPVSSNMPPIWLIGMVIALVALAGRLSIILSRQAEASLFTVPLFMAILLMHPAVAALAGALGALIFQLMLRRPGRAVAFNVAMTAMAGVISGIVYTSLRPEGALLALTQEHMIAAALAGLVLHLHNILPVLGIITLRKGRSFWASWGESYALEAIVEGMLLSLGLLAALLVVQASWGLILMTLPAFAAYQALKHTVEHAAKKGMLAEELERRLAQEFRGWESLSHNSPYNHSTVGGGSASIESRRIPLLRSALR